MTEREYKAELKAADEKAPYSNGVVSFATTDEETVTVKSVST